MPNILPATVKEDPKYPLNKLITFCQGANQSVEGEDLGNCRDYSGYYDEKRQLFQISGKDTSLPHFLHGFRNRTWINPKTGAYQQMEGTYDSMPDYVFQASSIGPRSEAVISQGVDQVRNAQPAMWAVSAYYAEDGCNIDFLEGNRVEYKDIEGQRIIFTRDGKNKNSCASATFVKKDRDEEEPVIDAGAAIRLYGNDVCVSASNFTGEGRICVGEGIEKMKKMAEVKGKKAEPDGKNGLSDEVNKCLVPGRNGVQYRYITFLPQTLWDRFYTNAPRQRNEFEKKYKNLQRAGQS